MLKYTNARYFLVDNFAAAADTSVSSAWPSRIAGVSTERHSAFALMHDDACILLASFLTEDDNAIRPLTEFLRKYVHVFYGSGPRPTDNEVCLANVDSA